MQKKYERLHPNINEVFDENKTQFRLIMNFSAEVGIQKGFSEREICPCRVGIQKSRGKLLVNYISENELYQMNTFFEKPKERK